VEKELWILITVFKNKQALKLPDAIQEGCSFDDSLTGS
jgi:hypothetical protein